MGTKMRRKEFGATMRLSTGPAYVLSNDIVRALDRDPVKASGYHTGLGENWRVPVGLQFTFHRGFWKPQTIPYSAHDKKAQAKLKTLSKSCSTHPRVRITSHSLERKESALRFGLYALADSRILGYLTCSPPRWNLRSGRHCHSAEANLGGRQTCA